MGGGEDEMDGVGDARFFGLRVASPKDEGDGVCFLVDEVDDGIGECFPAFIFVGIGLGMAHGQDGVEQEDALFCPCGEIAVVRGADAKVGVEFFVDVDEGWGRRRGAFYGEAQAVGLVVAVVGILSENEHLDAGIGGEVEGVEDIVHGGMDFRAPVFGDKKLAQGFVGWGFKSGRQQRCPVVMENFSHG